MAQGRMLKKDIAKSEKLGRLKSDKARVLYFMMLPHLDVEGRLEAHTRIIKGQITTMLQYSEGTIQRCLEELNGVGLLVLYRIDGDQYLQYTRFSDFQSLNPDKEAKTKIPAPTPENSGGLQSTPSKDKLNKDKYNLSKSKVKGKGFTLEQVKDSAYLVGVTDEKAEEFYNHYKSQGWKFGNNLPIEDLTTALARWRNKQYQFPDKKKPETAKERRERLEKK